MLLTQLQNFISPIIVLRHQKTTVHYDQGNFNILLFLYCNTYTYKVSTYTLFHLFITIHYISRIRIFESVRKNVHTRVCKMTPDGRFLRLVTSGFVLQRVDIFGACAPCRRTRPKERGCERGRV